MTKIVCTACRGLGQTRMSGKPYLNPANVSVTAIPCVKCSPVKAPTGFVKAKIRAATEAKLKAAHRAVTPQGVCDCHVCYEYVEPVADCPEIAWVTVAGQEFMVQAPKSGLPRVPRKVSRSVRKASPTTQNTRTRKA